MIARYRYQHLGIILLLLLPMAMQAQEFYARADRSEVAVDGIVRVTYTFENVDAEDFNPPNFSPFEAYGPSQATNVSWVNGKVSKTLSYTYTLKATAEGEFAIPAAVARVDGKVKKSNPVNIKVVAKSAVTPGPQTPANPTQPSQPKDLDGQIRENLFMLAVPSKTNLYEGEQVTITYKLYYSLELNDLSIVKMPSFDGFLSYDIELSDAQKARSVETYQGRNYHVQTIHQVALFPNKSGKFTIDPMQLQAVVLIRRNDPAYFFPRMDRIQHEFRSSSVNLNVKPLPAGRPAGFAGGVGQLDFSASYDKTEAQVGDPITLRIKVSGNGNIKLLEVPEPEFPQSFEVYDPKIKESISSRSYTVNGTKTFEYLVIPGGGGTFKMPDLTYAYFDPQKEQYISKTEEGPEIVVEGDALSPQNYPSSNLNKEDVELLGEDIRYIKTDLTGKVVEGGHLLTRPVFHLLTWLPVFLAMFLPFLYSRRKKMLQDTEGLRSRRAHKVAAKRMGTARKLMMTGDDQAFYNEVIKAFLAYVGDRFQMPTSELSKENIRQVFERHGLTGEMTTASLQLIDTCEMAIYAPMAVSDSKEAILAKASGLIQNIEKTATVK